MTYIANIIFDSYALNIVTNAVIFHFSAFFVYKLVMSLREKERAKEEKKKLKQARREKDKTGLKLKKK